MRLGRFTITFPNSGNFRLDGGAMFGSVPKNLWYKRIASDSDNCIPLATRSLLIKDGVRTVLVDVGNGTKWGDKQKEIFKFDPTPKEKLGFTEEEITDVVLTHLHFDHAGGISYFDESGALQLTYPTAHIYVQESNYKNASAPHLKERASYLKENVDVLNQAKLTLLHGNSEPIPGIKVHVVNGHTEGQQWIEVRDGSEVIFYPTDLIPTFHHIPIAFQMGYDMCAATVMKEKEAFLQRAYDEKALVVFEHDIETVAARIVKDSKGAWAGEPVKLA